MEIYVARQPILTRNQEVYAYELLYRNSKQNKFSNIDGDQATLDVINSFLQIGVDELSEGRPCFVNFTEKLLENDIPSSFQSEVLVVEILETVTPTDKVIDICRELKTKGYKIALDDFEMKAGGLNFYKLLGLADIIKIDIRNTPRDQQLKILHALKKYNVDFLAEKVETREEFEQCLKDGYKYFQGYFFYKPIILSTSDVPVQRHSFFQIMGELSQPEPEIDKITEVIEKDVSLSYKLLKLLNSTMFSRMNEIKSIKQAIVLLGLKELKKWIYVLSLREIANNKENQIPDEVIKMCFTRAKASELIAVSMGKRLESSSFFLLGMLSLIDTLLKQPIEKVISQLPLDKEIKEALLGSQTPYKDVLDLLIVVERAEWKEIGNLIDKVGIEKKKLFHLYKEAMKWTNGVLVEAL